MATILLSAAGAAIGGSIGGGALGLSSVVIGRALGAVAGRAIDQRLMGAGSETVQTGRMDRVRVMGASEGGAIARVFGRMRVAGNVIWSSRYREEISTEQARGGKGAPKGPTVERFSYSVSVAIALCDGEIARVGRVWADGELVAKADLNMRVYHGSDTQLPDPVMVAIEGGDAVPAYRGLAYVVMEDLPLSAFGNRVPQFSFEVVRPAKPVGDVGPASGPDLVQGVALMPGTGEHALATTPIYKPDGAGQLRPVNVNSVEPVADLVASLDVLNDELPNCKAASLVVSWFGDDLRAGECAVVPKVERSTISQAAKGSKPVDGIAGDTWSVSGIDRGAAGVVSQIEGRPIYGGTPSDFSVVEAIAALKDAGQDVMFYPFLLMEILGGNTKPDPWSDADTQAVLPWRGRITTHKAPGNAGSSDGTATARDEVAAFMGAALQSDFRIDGTQVQFTGAAAGGYRHFILHYAHLCKAAGGVGSFCIGSEMRAFTQIRDDLGFPAVTAFQQLAREVKAILGPDCKVGYAADWSEYFGYQPSDGSGDLFYHLDPLWADDAIDFIGIDNYMPISDWREGDDHLDASAGSIYDLDYLRGNIEGGEGYDWYYRDPQERRLQIRTPIEDGAYDEPWVYRYKDIRNWWSRPHFDRAGGVRGTQTAWMPQSKPIWFTELGCGAVDKGTNQPNKFSDPKSSESALPHFSTGRRDDYVQAQYLRAWHDYYGSATNNPVSDVYDGPMCDMSRAFVWAWDARPWPEFPGNLDLWSDGENHLTGHWLTGRAALQPLAFVVAELCEMAGAVSYDVSRLHGVVRGFVLADTETPRASLQVLMTIYGFDAVEQRGVLVFVPRDGARIIEVSNADLALSGDAPREDIRAPEAEIAGDVRLGYVEAEGVFHPRVADARMAGDDLRDSTFNDVPLALTDYEARAVAERWLAEARVARDRVQVTLPPSRGDIAVGDVMRLEDAALFRVDRVEDHGARVIEGVRMEPAIYAPSDGVDKVAKLASFVQPLPVTAQFMDLPLLRGSEVAHAPYIAVSGDPWPGGVAVYSSGEDSDYALNKVISAPATMGVLSDALPRGGPWVWNAGAAISVELSRGALQSVSRASVLNGANVAAIGDGSGQNWEIVQFAQAELIAPGRYILRDVLRGQAGTEALIPDIWPVGSRFVLLDSAPEQLDVDLSSRNLARHYRIGPARRPYDDPSYQHYVEASAGAGLRPYAPVHLRTRQDAGGLDVTWVRRTRVDGDSWAGAEVPLGEDTERYLVRISRGGVQLREAEVIDPHWHYGAALRGDDGGDVTIEVAQISASFGLGLFARMDIE